MTSEALNRENERLQNFKIRVKLLDFFFWKKVVTFLLTLILDYFQGFWVYLGFNARNCGNFVGVVLNSACARCL